MAAQGPNEGEAWKQADLANLYLDDIRGGVPLHGEQLALLERLVGRAVGDVRTLLDLGCGDGLLTHVLARRFPGLRSVLVDFSRPMLDQARARFGPDHPHRLVEADFSTPGWRGALGNVAPFDAAVSGFAIHHVPHERKRELYREVHQLLRPGGVFLNLEHVASASPWGSAVFDEIFVDSLMVFHRPRHPERTREEIRQEYQSRKDSQGNILAPVELQCQWLREIGYERVDCYFKLGELALFGGIKPA